MFEDLCVAYAGAVGLAGFEMKFKNIGTRVFLLRRGM